MIRKGKRLVEDDIQYLTTNSILQRNYECDADKYEIFRFHKKHDVSRAIHATSKARGCYAAYVNEFIYCGELTPKE